MISKKTLVIAPAHNEERGLKRFVESIFRELPSCSIVIVEDCSSDATWNEIVRLKQTFPNLVGVKLQKNVGQQRAILAGLEFAIEKMPQFDFYVTMDADGQDPEEYIPKMIEKARLTNSDLVVGYRNDRSSDSVWKRGPASLFYFLMRNLFKVNLTSHAAEFRVLTHYALKELISYKEARPFWRGLTEFSGLKKVDFKYDRRERKSDSSSYGLKQMLRLAESGVVSFSQVPLRFIFLLGLLITFFSFLAIVIYLTSFFFLGSEVQGWLSLILAILFFGGMVMFSLGIIGIYLLEVLENVRQRPQYSIREII